MLGRKGKQGGSESVLDTTDGYECGYAQKQESLSHPVRSENDNKSSGVYLTWLSRAGCFPGSASHPLLGRREGSELDR